MSPRDRSEEVGVLRARIAHIAANRAARPFAARQGRVALGDGCSLDRMLGGGLALAAVHEVVAGRPGDAAAACGFALALAVRLAAQRAGAIFWIIEAQAGLETGAPYGPGLGLHGLDPARLVLVHTFNAQESLWAMEEALKCRTAVVVGEIWGVEKAYDLVASRRLVLAAQKSGTPGLMLAAGMAGRAARLSTGAETRFEVLTRPGSPLTSAAARLPLPGAAVWAVRLAKARAGPNGFGFDREKFSAVLWDHEEGSFRDAFPLPLAALSGDRPDRPAAAADPSRRSA